MSMSPIRAMRNDPLILPPPLPAIFLAGRETGLASDARASEVRARHASQEAQLPAPEREIMALEHKISRYVPFESKGMQCYTLAKVRGGIGRGRRVTGQLGTSIAGPPMEMVQYALRCGAYPTVLGDRDGESGSCLLYTSDA